MAKKKTEATEATEAKPKSKRGGKREGAGRKVSELIIEEEKNIVKEAIDSQFEDLVKPEANTTVDIQQMAENGLVAEAQSVKPSRGVLLIAVGSPEYGKMAANAAASIRFSDREVNIHLVYTPSSITHLTDKHKALFSSMSECPTEYLTKNGKANFIKPKAYAYLLTPFDETLMLDVDLLMFGGKPISKLMDELSPLDFTAQCRGFYNYDTKKTTGKYTHWCDVEKAKFEYGLSGKIYQLSSEVVWFRKTEKVMEMLGFARDIFDRPLVDSEVVFSGDLPDEMGLNIAACKFGFAPRKDEDVFIYWEFQDKGKEIWSDVIKTYYGFSAGGNNIQPSALAKYSNMAKAHANALRLPYHFNIFPKKKWDANRRKL